MVTKRVLVIDDEIDIREIVQASLELTAGLEVIVACSSQEGLMKAELEQPHAILLDVMLPGMDGVSVLQALQANPATRHIPVIFLTARVHPVEQHQFTVLGAKAVISKPFKPARLASQLLKALNWEQEQDV